MYKVLVTGCTGLIGYNVVSVLLSQGFEVIGLVRDICKAEKMFGKQAGLTFVVGDVNNMPHVDGSIDYIIHGASQTSSHAFIDEPVETIKTAVMGTISLLELARKKNVKSFVYLSSMEVYGSPTTDVKINEQYLCNLDTMSTRSCYPESKRLCESLCRSYWTEYGVPAKVIRLTQTFGRGVAYNDGRVFAEFARCFIESRSIVLHTKGETKRCYLSTKDAVNAILTVLFNGENGEAYNAANEETYCSIYEMALLVAGNHISVEIQEDDTERGYAPILHMNLDTTKLRNLGWEPLDSLQEMFKELIDDMINSKNNN